MSTFGEDLIQSLGEALAHARGAAPVIVHAPVTPREVRRQAKLTQAQMAPLLGMSLSGYRKWEQLWVVHAFQKKAKQGIKTPAKEIDLIRERLKRLKQEFQP